MLIVAALGGNALLRRGEVASVANQRRNARLAVGALAPLALNHRLVLTHGNGPQVGALALQAAAASAAEAAPLDVLDAESEGMIGYLLERELRGMLPATKVATLLTQVRVDADDPAFERPSKPIGPVYDRATAERLAARRGWNVAPDGAYWRRVVPSPQPREIVELETIRLLVDAGVLVVCVGGGGIPVVSRTGGALDGVEAVIDKDLSAALLAETLGADALLLLTDVPFVERDHGGPGATPIHEASAAELRALELEPGSMAPKVEAAARFANARGGLAAIGSLTDAAALLDGSAGTRVRADPPRQRRTASADAAPGRAPLSADRRVPAVPPASAVHRTPCTGKTLMTSPRQPPHEPRSGADEHPPRIAETRIQR